MTDPTKHAAAVQRLSCSRDYGMIADPNGEYVEHTELEKLPDRLAAAEAKAFDLETARLNWIVEHDHWVKRAGEYRKALEAMVYALDALSDPDDELCGVHDGPEKIDLGIAWQSAKEALADPQHGGGAL